MHAPDPRAVSFSLSGFVIGVIATLLATGVISHTSADTKVVATLPAPTNVQPSAMEQRARTIVSRFLGPSLADQKLPRLLSLRLTPVIDLPEQFQPSNLDRRYRNVYIRLRLNEHPLGPVWRLRAAKADVFGVLKLLYTSGLPVYNTELVGRFPLKSGHSIKTVDAVVAYISHSNASRIPWRRWGRDHEAQLWNQLSYKIVRAGFG